MKTPNLDKVLERQVGGTHYKKEGIQPAKYIAANNVSFFCGCATKYIFRYSDKGGVEDLQKAIHYLEMQIAYEKDKQDNSILKKEKKLQQLTNDQKNNIDGAIIGYING